MPGNLDPRVTRAMAAIFIDGGMAAEAEKCLNTYLRAQPNDVDAWMKLAIAKDALGYTQDAYNAIRQAYQINAQQASECLRASEELQRIAAPLFQRR